MVESNLELPVPPNCHKSPQFNSFVANFDLPRYMHYYIKEDSTLDCLPWRTFCTECCFL
jgi:hypothetical protein